MSESEEKNFEPLQHRKMQQRKHQGLFLNPESFNKLISYMVFALIIRIFFFTILEPLLNLYYEVYRLADGTQHNLNNLMHLFELFVSLIFSFFAIIILASIFIITIQFLVSNPPWYPKKMSFNLNNLNFVKFVSENERGFFNTLDILEFIY